VIKTEKRDVPTVVTEPEITPVALLIERPAGSPVAAYVYGLIPPEPVTVCEYEFPGVASASVDPLVGDAASVVATAPTVIVTVALDDPSLLLAEYETVSVPV